jgi:hypothetical protein
MPSVRRVVLPLRVLLVVTFAAMLMLQFFSLPGQFAHMAKEHPGDAFLRWPLTIFGGLEVLCVQVVIVCTWRLLTLVQRDRIFSERSLVWVDGIVAAIAAGWLLLFAFGLYVGSRADDPGNLVVLLVLLLAGGVLGLLMVVMRELLRQATTLRTDMDAVI